MNTIHDDIEARGTYLWIEARALVSLSGYLALSTDARAETTRRHLDSLISDTMKLLAKCRQKLTPQLIEAAE